MKYVSRINFRKNCSGSFINILFFTCDWDGVQTESINVWFIPADKDFFFHNIQSTCFFPDNSLIVMLTQMIQFGTEAVSGARRCGGLREDDELNVA